MAATYLASLWLREPMSLQGPILLIAETPELASALTDARAFPVVHASWAGAQTAFDEIKPAAVVASAPGAADEGAAAEIAAKAMTAEPFVPMLLRLSDAMAAPDHALAISDAMPPERLVAR